MMEWQTMDSAPRDGTRILVLIDEKRQTVVRWKQFLWKHGWTVYYEDSWLKWLGKPVQWMILGLDAQPTHWMPLPPAPTIKV